MSKSGDFNNLKITTLNVKSVRSENKWQIFLTFLQTILPDILILQETNLNQLHSIPSNIKYNFLINPSPLEYRGTITAYNPNIFALKSHDILVDGLLEKTVLTLLRFGIDFVILNIYLPHDPLISTEVLNILDNTLKDCAKLNVILGGDFNCTINEITDRINSHERYNGVVKILKGIVTRYNLADVWTEVLNLDGGFTFLRGNPVSASRLDRFYVSSPIASKIKHANTEATFSDHLSLNVYMDFCFKKFRPPYWRLNNDLLEDENYKELIKHFIEKIRNSHNSRSNPLKAWELLKLGIKELSIKYNIEKNKNTYGQLEKLNKSLTSHRTFSNETVNDVLETNEAARDIYQNITERKLKTARYEQIYMSDKPMAKQIADKLQKITMNELRIGNKITSDEKLITKTVWNHFREIYNDSQVNEPDPTNYIDNAINISFTEDEKNELGCDFIEDEFTTALRSLSRNRSPGIDGLTVEFYICFWGRLKDLYFGMIRRAIECEELPKSLRTAVISLVYKKGDKFDLKNWRPVSIPCSDYKILARTISNRIKNVISKIIRPDQSFCIPNRSIFDCLHLTRNIIRHVNVENKPLAVISLDQSGAFDRVNRTYLMSVLEKYGFPAYIIRGIKTLYQDATAMVRVGGSLTSEISLCRGVRQGCPLSGLLFAISMEPFLENIRRNLVGVHLGPSCSLVKVVAYADDITIFTDHLGDVNTVFKTFKTYQNVSGAELNVQKSKGLWTGAWKRREDSPYNLTWSNKSIRILGVNFEHNVDIISERTINELKVKIERASQRWKPLMASLSYQGRRCVINSFVAPRLWYTLQVIPISDRQLTEMQKMITTIFWNNKKHWTDEKHLYLPHSMGGIGLVNLKSKVNVFRISYAIKYLQDNIITDSRNVLEAELKLRRKRNFTWQNFFLEEETHYCRRNSTFINQVFDAWYAFTPSVYTSSIKPTEISIKKGELSIDIYHPQVSYKKTLLEEFVMTQFQTTNALKGIWNDEKVNWKSMGEFPILGRRRDVAWRFAKDRLADTVFLSASGLADSPRCHWCGERGTSWHIIISCRKHKELWNTVRILIGKCLRRRLLYMDITNGIANKNNKTLLANFILSEAKYTTYNIHTRFHKDGEEVTNSGVYFVNSVKKRILEEYLWCSSRGMMAKFKNIWTTDNILCGISEGNDLTFSNF